MPVSRDVLTGQPDIGTGPFGTVGNIIWLLLAGIWIAMQHLIWALFCAVTIIGIPFAWQHVKLAALASAHRQDHCASGGGRGGGTGGCDERVRSSRS